ncbi:MFS general substrate transporter [Xylariaceae sp. FL0804]|nr:MFS general substrate transporter [Xylariaceae sp. FL0804]
MTRDSHTYNARVVSSVAATIISLACGTNYVYSAWAPQFADKLHLSATESEIIGLAGNLGMYLVGYPIGLFIDSRGPRPAVLVGSFLMIIGYMPIRWAYDAGSGSVPWLCLVSFLSGLGGCMAFAGAIKTSALNWPHHRGTAIAFPLAAFGLSAFFFSLVASIFFPGSPSKFLMLLSTGTFGMSFVGFFFLRVLPHQSPYQALPDADPGLADSQELRRTVSQESKASQGGRNPSEPGMFPGVKVHSTTKVTPDAPDQGPKLDETGEASPEHPGPSRARDVEAAVVAALPDNEADESSSLLSNSSSSSSLAGDVPVQNSVDLDRSHRIDIRGMRLVKSLEFWQLFSIMGILSGIGLMTINNIGNDATALWKHYDDSIDDKTLVQRQQLHVSLLSLGSFSGRLLSGVGSDFLVKVLHASRIWCLVIASSIFALAQVCALNILNPHLLGLVSGLSGLGYGFLFGVFPSIVAESFGIHALSQNWGIMTVSPVLSGNVFNLFYGWVFDAHSVIDADGGRTCTDGIDCYWAAYVVTVAACALGLALTLWTIFHQWQARSRERGVDKGHAGE